MSVARTENDFLVKLMEALVAEHARELKAWKQIANNFALAMELNGLHGKRSLAQQIEAHGLTL